MKNNSNFIKKHINIFLIQTILKLIKYSSMLTEYNDLNILVHRLSIRS